MKRISDEIISVEEARAALRCMLRCGLNEEEALESIDSVVERIRKVSTSKLVEEIIETRLSQTQRLFIKEYWYQNKNTAQIARENDVSQANVYRTIARANETIKDLLTPLYKYYMDLSDVKINPLYVEETLKICSAANSSREELSEKLKNLRISKAVTPEQLAQAVCITVKDLELIENGKKEPTVALLNRYSKVFGIEINLKITDGKGRYEWKEVLLN